MSEPAPLTSPRIERLRELYAKLEDPVAQARRTDGELNAICDEVYAISDDILASPAGGVVGVTEHAMAVHYWFRAGEGPDIASVQALVAAVFALATSTGGARG